MLHQSMEMKIRKLMKDDDLQIPVRNVTRLCQEVEVLNQFIHFAVIESTPCLKIKGYISQWKWK